MDYGAKNQKKGGKTMKKLKSTALKLWRDESGQGTAEYVLILVGIVALGFLFKNQIVQVVKGKMMDIGKDIKGFTAN